MVYFIITVLMTWFYSSTANVLRMSKCGLCQPQAQEIHLLLSHWPGLGV